MISDIGRMIAACVVTRMVRLLVKQDPKEHGGVVAFAVATICVTVF